MEQGIQLDKELRREKKWFRNKMFDHKQKNDVGERLQKYRKDKVARLKDIEETFAQKCILAKSTPKPSEFQQTLQLLGTSDMLPARLRAMCKNILQKELGIIKPPTQQEKNLKAFEKYEMTQE